MKLNYLDQNKHIYIIHDDTFVPALSMMIKYMTSLIFFLNILASSITISCKPCDAKNTLDQPFATAHDTPNYLQLIHCLSICIYIPNDYMIM